MLIQSATVCFVEVTDKLADCRSEQLRSGVKISPRTNDDDDDHGDDDDNDDNDDDDDDDHSDNDHDNDDDDEDDGDDDDINDYTAVEKRCQDLTKDKPTTVSFEP